MTPRAIRLSVYLLIVLAILGWDTNRRWWTPSAHQATAHYAIDTTATPAQTDEIARAAEVQYQTYCATLRAIPGLSTNHPPLKMALYKDRDEMRRVNRMSGWAEAFYRAPVCHAYYSAKEVSPLHWMLHEAVHQLNHEVAHLTLEKWLEEGTACLFSSSLANDHEVRLGTVDVTTYPAWWLDTLATAGQLDADLKNGSVIPLRAIVTGKGGPKMDEQFNLYYLHWWTLTLFLYHAETGKYRAGWIELLQQGGTLDAFEKHIGPVERVQAEWYRYVQELKRSPAGVRPRKPTTRSAAFTCEPVGWLAVCPTARSGSWFCIS